MGKFVVKERNGIVAGCIICNDDLGVFAAVLNQRRKELFQVSSSVPVQYDNSSAHSSAITIMNYEL